LWIGRGEGRDPETDNVGLSCGGGNGSTKRDHCGRRDRAERRVSTRGSVGHRTDGRPRPVGRHLLLAARRRSSLDLVTQQRQANRQHLAAQQQRGDESDEREFHARSGIYYGAVGVVTPSQSAKAGIGSTHRSRRRSNPQAWAEGLCQALVGMVSDFLWPQSRQVRVAVRTVMQGILMRVPRCPA